MGRTTAPKTEQTPTIGRIVHYYTEPAGEQRAAIVSELDGDVVTLHVLNSHGVFVLVDVPEAPVPTPGHWSWPTVPAQVDANTSDEEV